MDYIREKLFSMSDEGYRDFQSGLLPDIPKEKILGVRTPLLRKFAKEIYGSPFAEEFLRKLPHEFYEENNLHAFLIEQIPDFRLSAAAVSEFLPYIDNWATCDSLSPKVFLKNREELLPFIEKWLSRKDTFGVRFGIKMLMEHFLGEDFSPVFPEKVAEIRSEEYYVRMMQAWYFATALAKQYEAVLPLIAEKRLEKWVHNKAIQKSVESLRIPPERKEYLRSLKIR